MVSFKMVLPFYGRTIDWFLLNPKEVIVGRYLKNGEVFHSGLTMRFP
jgi:hypothetical protein